MRYSAISAFLRLQVLKRDGYKCLCCGKRNNLTMDHVVPVSSGGSTTLHNLQTLCFPCNQKKDANTVDYRPCVTVDAIQARMAELLKKNKYLK